MHPKNPGKTPKREKYKTSPAPTDLVTFARTAVIVKRTIIPKNDS